MIDERATYAATLFALLALSGAAVGLSGGGAEAPAPADATGEYNTTADGTRYTVHPSELVQGCPAGTDCIPSIDDPTFQPAGEAGWLEGGDRVIGVTVEGEARAYPLRILNVHEIVNDEIAGKPIAVTYCPLCRSGLVFSRRVGNTTLTFGVSGKLLDANLVMYDRETETYWSQLEGKAIVGPLVPRELTLLPSAITTWAEWKAAHPDTAVLSRDTGIFPESTYGSNPYGGYANRSGVGFGVGEVDDRLPSKALVHGLTIGGTSVAYPEETITAEDAINDRVEDVPVLLVEDPDEGSVKVFVREVENETLTFEVRDGRLVDGAGNRWSFDGEALEGPHEGRRLERIETHGFFWFAWSSFHPDTEVYRGDESG